MAWSLRVAIAVLGVAGLSACAPKTDEFASQGEGFPTLSAAGTAAVDWSTAEIVEVELSAYEFTPADLSFQTATPYRLVLTNAGEGSHNFVSEGFFKAIVVHELRTPEGAVANPYVTSIAVPPGTTKELRFMAVERGSYDLECTVALHSLFGMTGTIDVL